MSGDGGGVNWKVALVLALAAPAATGAFQWVGGWQEGLLEERRQTVSMAMAILQADPKESEHMTPLRTWAINVVDQFSGIPLDDATKKALLIQQIDWPMKMPSMSLLKVLSSEQLEKWNLTVDSLGKITKGPNRDSPLKEHPDVPPASKGPAEPESKN